MSGWRLLQLRLARLKQRMRRLQAHRQTRVERAPLPHPLSVHLRLRPALTREKCIFSIRRKFPPSDSWDSEYFDWLLLRRKVTDEREAERPESSASRTTCARTLTRWPGGTCSTSVRSHSWVGHEFTLFLTSVHTEEDSTQASTSSFFWHQAHVMETPKIEPLDPFLFDAFKTAGKTPLYVRGAAAESLALTPRTCVDDGRCCVT